MAQLAGVLECGCAPAAAAGRFRQTKRLLYCNEARAQASREFSAKWCLMVRFRAGNYEALGRGMQILVGRCPLILSITHAVCWAEDPYILVCIVLLKIHL